MPEVTWSGNSRRMRLYIWYWTTGKCPSGYGELLGNRLHAHFSCNKTSMFTHPPSDEVWFGALLSILSCFPAFISPYISHISFILFLAPNDSLLLRLPGHLLSRNNQYTAPNGTNRSCTLHRHWESVLASWSHKATRSLVLAAKMYGV